MRQTDSCTIRFGLAALALALTVPACGGAEVSTQATTPAPEVAAAPEEPEQPEMVDSDGDGIPDDEDMCPETPGVANTENPARHGCPERRRSYRARIDRNRVVIDEKIMFATNAATIEAESESLLDEIAETIVEAGRRVALIEIAGHADQRGNAARNLTLTEERAAAVVAALVARGVDADKLRAKGYGSHCPIADDDDANRRVEIVILKSRRRATGAQTGCEAATAAGIQSDPVD